MGTALPTAAHAKANTMKPTFMWAVITKANGSKIEIPCMDIAEEIQIGTVKRYVPIGSYLQSDRTVATTRDQAFVIKIDEFVTEQRALAFGDDFTEGSCQFFVVDPADAATKVKLQSQDFSCSVLPASGMGMNRDAFSEYSMRIEANEVVDFIFDQTVDYTPPA